jgi:rRNA maturation protein Nop10
MNITAETSARTYTVVYARGAAHIQGLDEVPRDFGHEDAPAYTMSACAALSKNPYFWCDYWTGSDLAEALVKLEECGRYVAKGHCKKCHKTAAAAVEAAPAEESYADKFERTFGL